MNRPEERMKNYLKYFNWKGGIIHQIAQETGCTVNDLLYGKANQIHLSSDYSKGYFALNTCGIEYRLKFVSENKGNINFWLGVGDSR